MHAKRQVVEFVGAQCLDPVIIGAFERLLDQAGSACDGSVRERFDTAYSKPVVAETSAQPSRAERVYMPIGQERVDSRGELTALVRLLQQRQLGRADHRVADTCYSRGIELSKRALQLCQCRFTVLN